jgi:hypothetical protein
VSIFHGLVGQFLYVAPSFHLLNRNAQRLLERVKAMKEKFDRTNTTGEYEMASDLTERLEDLLAIAKATELKNREISDQNRDNQAALDEIQAILAILAAQEQQVEDCIASATAKAENASHALWNESSANYQASENMLAELRSARSQLEEKVGLLEQNIPVSKQILDDALAHAKNLEDQASGLSQQFEETKLAAEDPLKAASVYEDIEEAIERADEAVMKAAEAAANASEAVVGLPGGPLVDQAKGALEKSKDLYDDSTTIQTKMRDLGSDLYEHVNENEKTEASNQEEKARVEELHLDLDGLHLDVTNKARDQTEKADDILNRVEESKQKAEEKQIKIREELEPKLQELLEAQEEGLREAHRSVTDAERRFAHINNVTNVLEGRHAQIDRIGKDLSSSILALKEKIQVARAQANSVRDKTPMVHSTLPFFSCIDQSLFVPSRIVCTSL